MKISISAIRPTFSRAVQAALPAILLATIAPATAAPASWSHEGSDIRPDSDVVWGGFGNGFRYAILPHGDPEGRVSLRLFVDAGSVMEEDDQQGLAHFTEHMAFNGTEHFAAGEMVEYFQRLGMGFGADTNAHTSFKETVYKLDLPSTDEKLLRESLQLLRDYADGILFADEEIEKERGVILSEKLARDSVDYRTYIESLKFNLPDSLLSRRVPIGTEDSIKNAPRQRFLDYYREYYTPDRMVLVAVGDIEPAAIEQLIGEYFESFRGEGRGDPDLGTVSERGEVAFFHPEEEASASFVIVESLKPYERPADSQERRALELRESLANRMLSRRFDLLSKTDDAPFMYGQASNRDTLNFVTTATVQMMTKPENWKETLSMAEQELRRALEHGFTEAELDEARANVRQVYERRAQTASTRKSKDIANTIVSRVAGERVFTNPVDDLPRVMAELETVTTDETLEALRGLWPGRDVNVFVSGNIDFTKEEGRKAVLAAYSESKEVKVEAPSEEEAKAFAYADDKALGEVASETKVEDLGVTQVVYKNGIRLNLKQTDFEENTIQVTARFGGGKLVIPADKPGIGTFVGSTFTLGGLGEHSAAELERIFAGTTVRASFSVADDAFVLSGKVKPEDFLSQVRLMTAYLVEPGFRSEAESQFQRSVDAIYRQLKHTPEGILQNDVARLVRSGDPRFGYPEKEELLKRNQAEARAWMTPHLKEGYLEITVVGDFVDEATVIESVGRTFGALTARQSEKPAFKEERAVAFPDKTGEQRFPFVSDIPKSAVAVYWKTTDMWDIQRSRRMNLLSAVMRDRLRLKIREELGDAYSPYARSSMSDTFTGFGYLVAMVESDREKAANLAGILRDIAQDLKEKGINEDELERAKKPLMTMLTEYRRNNSYWVQSVLQSSQEHPQRLDWARSILEDYGDATVEEVNALAKEFLSAAGALSVLVISEDG